MSEATQVSVAVGRGAGRGRAPAGAGRSGWRAAGLLALAALLSVACLAGAPAAAATTVTNWAVATCDGGIAVSNPAEFEVTLSDADFSAFPTSGPAPLTVSFTDLSAGSPDTWLWDFGDGQTSTEQNPIHVFTSPGVYTVTLTVASAGGTAATSKVINVFGAALEADFDASRTSGPAPLTVSFTDLSTGGPTSWSWDFGDGETSTEQHPTHVYLNPGTYVVQLVVANALGTSSASKLITVYDAAPVARFGADPTDGQTPLTVSFTDLSSGGPVSWHWSFGDGTTSTQQHPVHTYTTPGVYDVTLTISNGTQSDTETKPAYIVSGFFDVGADYWAYSGIMACLKAGMLLGYPDGTFRPLVQITRDQIAVYLARALAGGDARVPNGPTEPTFSDVLPDYWAYKYIEYVFRRNIILGYPDGTFRPQLPVNRAQMAVFLARTLANPPGEVGLEGYTPPATQTFPDVTATNTWSWCYKYVEYIAAKGVTSGYPDGLYHPERICTRDQLAVYLARTFKLTL